MVKFKIAIAATLDRFATFILILYTTDNKFGGGIELSDNLGSTIELSKGLYFEITCVLIGPEIFAISAGIYVILNLRYSRYSLFIASLSLPLPYLVINLKFHRIQIVEANVPTTAIKME